MDLHLTNARLLLMNAPRLIQSWAGPHQVGRAASVAPPTARIAVSDDSRGDRHRLLPALHAIHDRIGWISPGALNYLALRIGCCARGDVRRRVVSTECSRLTAASSGSARLRRHRLRHARRRKTLRRTRTQSRSCEFAMRRRTCRLAAQPMPGIMRTRAGRVGHCRRREARASA